MKRKIYIIGLALSMIPFTAAQSQVRTDRKEKAIDRKEIRISEAQLERDLKELQEFKTRKEELKKAFAERDEKRMNILHAELIGAMGREIEQSEQKTFADKKELKRSKKEVRKDRRKSRDDIRDVRDDRRDMSKQTGRTRNQIMIRDEFLGWRFHGKTGGDPNEVAEILLLEKFIKTLENDIAETRKELGEDHRELREYRRKLREDIQ